MIDGVGTTSYVHTDQLGTPRAVTSSTGTVIWVWDFEGNPFGELASANDPDGNGVSTIQSLRFPGQYFDVESGMHHNYFRDYESSTGRYIESDPVGLRGGISIYSYAGAHPLTMVDPKGLKSCGQCATVDCLLYGGNVCPPDPPPPPAPAPGGDITWIYACVYNGKCAPPLYIPPPGCRLGCNLKYQFICTLGGAGSGAVFGPEVGIPVGVLCIGVKAMICDVYCDACGK
jgi:RHS repeat-associated protein